MATSAFGSSSSFARSNWNFEDNGLMNSSGIKSSAANWFASISCLTFPVDESALRKKTANLPSACGVA